MSTALPRTTATASATATIASFATTATTATTLPSTATAQPVDVLIVGAGFQVGHVARAFTEIGLHTVGLLSAQPTRGGHRGRSPAWR